MPVTAAPLVHFPTGFRSVFSSSRPLRQLLAGQSALLGDAARLAAGGDLRDHHRNAAANHRQSLLALRTALVTPFDSEDIADLLGGIARTVNCLNQVAGDPDDTLLPLAREWALLLAGIIPTLPETRLVDRSLAELRRLDRAFRLAEREAFTLPLEPLEAVRRQAVRERYQALRSSLRDLTFQARRVRYRNG